MKVYAVIISDYDLYGEYGFYLKREKAEARLEELKADPNFLWKKHLRIAEKDVIEQ